MEKINWINGQAGGTPLSAENLNQMQDNIENAINESIKTKIITGQEAETNEFIDEKKVYTRSYIITSIPDNSTIDCDLGFNMSDVTIWQIIGLIKNQLGNCFPLTSGDIGAEDSASVRLSINASTNKIIIKTINANFIGGEARATIKYTKN